MLCPEVCFDLMNHQILEKQIEKSETYSRKVPFRFQDYCLDILKYRQVEKMIRLPDAEDLERDHTEEDTEE